MKMVKIWSLKKKKKGRLKTFFVEGEEAHEDEEHLGATEEAVSYTHLTLPTKLEV